MDILSHFRAFFNQSVILNKKNYKTGLYRKRQLGSLHNRTVRRPFRFPQKLCSIQCLQERKTDGVDRECTSCPKVAANVSHKWHFRPTINQSINQGRFKNPLKAQKISVRRNVKKKFFRLIVSVCIAKNPLFWRRIPCKSRRVFVYTSAETGWMRKQSPFPAVYPPPTSSSPRHSHSRDVPSTVWCRLGRTTVTTGQIDGSVPLRTVSPDGRSDCGRWRRRRSSAIRRSCTAPADTCG